MNDQGEKIVFLAREILNAGLPEYQPRKNAMNVSMTFKTLCFTAVLAASGGAVTANWALENTRPLNRYERVEIDALVFYAARTKGINEENLRKEIEQKVGVVNLDVLTANEFPAVRKFLQEKAQ